MDFCGTEEQFTSAGRRDHFEYVISADQIGRLKPARKVCDLAAKRLDMEPGQGRLGSRADLGCELGA